MAEPILEGEESPIYQVRRKVALEKKNKGKYTNFFVVLEPFGALIQTQPEASGVMSALTYAKTPDDADHYSTYDQAEAAAQVIRDRYGFSKDLLIVVHDYRQDKPEQES